MTTFDQIYLVDLHGSAKKKERSPNGEKDENVFDIEQGVAISLFIKKENAEKGVWHNDLWGRRLAKYQAATLNSKSTVTWTKIEPEEPDWLFKPQDSGLGRKYREFWSMPAIFERLGDPAPGIVTTHDEFAISFSRLDAKRKVQALISSRDEKHARELFKLCSQEQWNYQTAKSELPKLDLDSASKEISYRPFDSRWTIWDSNVAVHRRERVMRHMLSKNVAITTSRQAGAIGSVEFDAVMAVDLPVDFNFYRRGGEFVFPLMFSRRILKKQHAQRATPVHFAPLSMLATTSTMNQKRSLGTSTLRFMLQLIAKSMLHFSVKISLAFLFLKKPLTLSLSPNLAGNWCRRIS